MTDMETGYKVFNLVNFMLLDLRENSFGIEPEITTSTIETQKKISFTEYF